MGCPMFRKGGDAFARNDGHLGKGMKTADVSDMAEAWRPSRIRGVYAGYVEAAEGYGS